MDDNEENGYNYVLFKIGEILEMNRRSHQDIKIYATNIRHGIKYYINHGIVTVRRGYE